MRRRPAAVTVCAPRVFEHRLVGALGEARRVVHRRDGDREGLRGADVSTPPLAVPPLSCSCTVTVAAAVGIGGRRVGQRAVGRDRRLHREQRVVVVA